MARSRRQQALYGEPAASVRAPGPPALTQPRAETARRLQERIELGKSLQAKPIDINWQVETYKADTKKWSNYNEELLKRLFTNDTLHQEYTAEYLGILTADPSSAFQVYRGNIASEIRILESILGRLELYPEPAGSHSETPPAVSARDMSKVFVVHGHDEGAREGVARFLEKIGLKAIILAEQPNRGRTIIEKFGDSADEVGFAVVLLTPDDLGGATADASQKSRARQNVIFELGYFVGSLGRGRACLLRKGEVEIPSDLYGVVYTTMDGGNGWKLELARELWDAGFQFDAEKVLR